MIKIDSLSNITIFEELKPDQLTQVFKLIRPIELKPNKTVIEHEDTDDRVFFVFQGKLKSTTFSVSGKEICFQNLKRGDMFGELSAIDNRPRTSTIITETNCLLGTMLAIDLRDLMIKYPSVMHSVQLRLTSLIRFLCARIYEYNALDASERTRLELLRLSKKSDSNSNYAVIENMPTHESIANQIASHREAVTKEINRLKKLGLIKKKEKALIIPDLSKLSLTIVDSLSKQ